MNASDLYSTLAPVAVLMPRLLGFVLILPVLSGKAAPFLVRNAFAIAIAIFAYPIAVEGFPPSTPTTLEWLVLLVKEALVGLAIGFVIGIPIWIFESAGGLIDNQSGLNNAMQMDPSSNHQIGPTGETLKQFAVTLFLTGGWLTQATILVVASFRFWPWSRLTPDWNSGVQLDVWALLLSQSESLWQLMVVLAGPVLLGLLLAELGLGLINRATPQFDVFSIGMPLKVALSVLLVATVVIFWADSAPGLWAASLDLMRSVILR